MSHIKRGCLGGGGSQKIPWLNGIMCTCFANPPFLKFLCVLMTPFNFLRNCEIQS